jgi:hypothetical protein
MRKDAFTRDAANKIIKCYKDYKLRVAMRRHIKTRRAMHTLLLVYWSRIHVGRRRKAANLLRVICTHELRAASEC